MAGTGDDPAALRAELVTMLPALRDVINWRQNHCGPLENEVQGGLLLDVLIGSSIVADEPSEDAVSSTAAALATRTTPGTPWACSPRTPAYTGER